MSEEQQKRNPRKRKRKRAITVRKTDEQGNIRVTKFKRKESKYKLSISAFRFKRLPATFLSLLFIIYALGAYAHKQGTLMSYQGPLDNLLQYYFYVALNPLMASFLAGLIGMSIAIFFAYALLTQGFNIKKWMKAFRQIMTILLAYLVLSAVISPIVNEHGIIRQVDDKDFSPWEPNIDLSQLSSPLYDDLINGLMSLLDGLNPNIADDIIANITAADGLPLDSIRDNYLFRWRAEEYWDQSANAYKQKDTSTIQDFLTADDWNLGSSYDVDSLRKFQIQGAFYTVGSSYSGQIIAPWNSEIGTAADAPSTYTAKDATGDNPVSGDITGYRGVNEDPNIVMTLNNPAASGYVEYNSVWKSEDKGAISTGAVALKDLESTIIAASNPPTNRIPADKFNDAGNGASGISATWGLYSLPGGPDYYNTAINPDAAEFAAARANFLQSVGGDNGSAFSVVVAVNNFIQNEVLKAMNAGTLSTDITNAQPDAAGSMDAAYYFYKAIQPNSNLEWGLKDVLPGYVNMLRALGIPARLVTGFAGGDINNINGQDTLQLTFYNTQYWIEALIPWVDQQGTTHFSWGEFNPTPIFSALQNQNIAYGRNALGTNPDMKLSINSGSNELAGSPYKLHTMGDNFSFSVNVDFDGNPAPSQIINFRLINEADLNSLNSGGFDPTSGVPGVDIGSVTTNSSGIAVTSGKVYVNGTIELANGTKRANTIEALDVTALLNPGGGNPTHAYGVVALFGLAYAYNGTGWIKNGTVVSTVLDKTPETPNGAVFNGTAYLGIPTEIFHFNATIFKTDLSESIPAQSLTLLMYASADFQTLDPNDPAVITQGKANAEQILVNGTATITTPSDSGSGEWYISFPLGGSFPTNNQLYVFVVYWEGSLVYSDPIGIIMVNDVTIATTGVFNGVPIINSGNPTITGWTITTSATSATALIAGGSGNVADVQLEYWLINAQIYDHSTAATWTLFDSRYLQNNSVTENIHYYNLSKGIGSPATSYATGGAKTDATGTAITTLTLNIANLAAGYYYIFVGAPNNDKFVQQHNGTDVDPVIFLKQDTLIVNSEGRYSNMAITNAEITTTNIESHNIDYPDFQGSYLLAIFSMFVAVYTKREVTI